MKKELSLGIKNLKARKKVKCALKLRIEAEKYENLIVSYILCEITLLELKKFRNITPPRRK